LKTCKNPYFLKGYIKKKKNVDLPKATRRIITLIALFCYKKFVLLRKTTTTYSQFFPLSKSLILSPEGRSNNYWISLREIESLICLWQINIVHMLFCCFVVLRSKTFLFTSFFSNLFFQTFFFKQKQ
jgi:hypothetical protein